MVTPGAKGSAKRRELRTRGEVSKKIGIRKIDLHNSLLSCILLFMNKRCYLFVLVMSAMVSLLFSSCASTDFNRIPRTSFIQHYEEINHPRSPFISAWDCQTDAEWNASVNNKRHLYISPVTLQHFQTASQTAADRKQIEELRAYFDTRLREEMAKAVKKHPNLILVDKPTAGAWQLDVALLSARPVSVAKNALVTGAAQAVGGGFIWDRVLSTKEESKGYVSMAARVTNGQGKRVTEVADFEYGMGSLTGMVLADTKDFRPFAYQRRSIDHWAEEFAELFTTTASTSVSRPYFSINPF